MYKNSIASTSGVPRTGSFSGQGAQSGTYATVPIGRKRPSSPLLVARLPTQPFSADEVDAVLQSGSVGSLSTSSVISESQNQVAFPTRFTWEDLDKAVNSAKTQVKAFRSVKDAGRLRELRQHLPTSDELKHIVDIEKDRMYLNSRGERRAKGVDTIARLDYGVTTTMLRKRLLEKKK